MTDGPQNEEATILSGYLEAVRPRPGEPDLIYLPDMMDTWSYAAKTHNDDLLSQVAAALALLLHIGSRSLHLLADMRGICETIFHERHLSLVARNLSADKELGFVISPALRLLREMVCFDGGAYARRVFRLQQWTFAHLTHNLDVRFRGDGVEDPQRPSVRTNAAKFLLSLVKYLPIRERGELVAVKGLVSGLLMKMAFDPPDLIHETLDCMMEAVLSEDEIPRAVKSRLFWAKVLVRMVALYSYTHDRPGFDVSVAEKAHDFFLFACTSPVAGIVAKCNGFYPSSLDWSSASNSAGGGLDGAGDAQLYWMEQFDGEPSRLGVRNEVLLEVSESLKPWANDKHRELLVAMFRAAPELVAAYFRTHQGLDFSPKLSTFWVGYSAFLYSATELPLPKYFDSRRSLYSGVPPPTSVILDSVIPRPLDRAVLLRCLEPKWPLVSLFATRLLIKSFEKLEAALCMHDEAAGGRRSGFASKMTSPWHLAAEKLSNSFSERVPDLKEIIRWYKSVPSDSFLSRTSTSQLLLLYYRILPVAALRANFDVSPFLAGSLKIFQSQAEDPKDRMMALMELENLMEVASISPGMRWFSKLPGQSMSAFTVFLKLSCGEVEGLASERLKGILQSVAADQIVLASTGLQAIYRAFDSLKAAGPYPPDIVWTLLDLSINKCATNTLRCLSLAPVFCPSLYEKEGEFRASPVFMAIIEQLSFWANKPSPEINFTALSQFLSAYISHSIRLGESAEWMNGIASHMNTMMPRSCPIKLHWSDEPVFQSAVQEGASQRSLPPERGRSRPRLSAEAEVDTISLDSLEQLLHEEYPIPLENGALTRWATKGVDEIIDDKHAVLLMRLLLSEHASIRKEALTNLLKMAAKVHESSYSEKVQTWLLLSELAESSKTLIEDRPAPSAFVAFAVHALPILASPLHPVYEKVNKFLMKAPGWGASRIPLLHDILQDAPTDEGTYYAERAWLFPFLLDCLQTTADLDLFRRSGCFEEICTEISNPYMKTGLRTRVFKILYRATCIEGGSTTLVTRFGIMSWLEMQRQDYFLTKEEKLIAAALKERVWRTCDQGRVSTWSHGSIPALMGRID